MPYVVAQDGDGRIVDVTRRYAPWVSNAPNHALYTEVCCRKWFLPPRNQKTLAVRQNARFFSCLVGFGIRRPLCFPVI